MRQSQHWLAIVFGTLLFLPIPPLAASERMNVIRNGGFESGAVLGATPAGWVKVSNCFGAWNGQAFGHAVAKEGSWMLHPGAGHQTGGAFQDVTTYPNQAYRLTFWVVGFPDGGHLHTTADIQRGRVQIGSPGPTNHDLAAENQAELLDMPLEAPKFRQVEDWRFFSFEFTATARTTRITFENYAQGPGQNAINVDDVRLEPRGDLVPEFAAALRQAEQDRRHREQRWTAIRAQCPRVVYVKRHHFRSPGAGGVLQCWDVFSPGGGIYVFDPRNPRAGQQCVFDSARGVVFDMSLSFDATKVLFSWMDLAEAGKDSFHIFEADIAGGQIRQLTHGRFHDVSPIYLPDGRVGFVSTRAGSFSMCQDAPASALHVMNADGSSIRRIQFGTLADFSPYVLDDGSILFTRWEYQDKSVFSVQSLWTVRPDGRQLQLVYGNTITVPNTIWQAKPIPDSRQFLCTMAPHHRNLVGAIGILDPTLGKENPAALTNITPEIPYTPTTDPAWQPGDQLYYWSYRDPWPLEKDLFVVSYGGEVPNRYRLYLLNRQGEKDRLLEDESLSCFNAIPLVPRQRPHDVWRAEPTEKPTGTFLLVDVYQGLGKYGIQRGEIKALRVMTQERKPTNNRGRRAYFHGHDIVDPVIGAGTFYVKHNCGTVPVHADGSAYFRAPAGTELYFQALDADGKELARMGSYTQLVAGERQACIGCHEPRRTAPPDLKQMPLALSHGPMDIEPPAWGAGPVDFVQQVQPVLDQYCVSCHGGVDPDGGIDLSGDKTRHFNMAYDNLASRNLVQFYYLTPPQELTGHFVPLSSGAHASHIVDLMDDGHGDVQMDARSRRALYAWIEANIPYYGTYEHTRPGTAGSRDAWTGEWIDKVTATFDQRCADCHGKLDRQQNRHSTWVNLTHPEYSRVLNAPLAKSAGGLELCQAQNGKSPVRFADQRDRTYQDLLAWITAGAQALMAQPRMDMPGAVAASYEQDFGHLYHGGGK